MDPYRIHSVRWLLVSVGVVPRVFKYRPRRSVAFESSMNFANIIEAAGDRIRVSPEGKYSVDDVMKYAMSDSSQAHRCNTYRRVREQFDLRAADRANFGPGCTTPVATADELELLLGLLFASRRPVGRPRSTRCVRPPTLSEDALYVMRYSHDPNYVKIGRSRNVEGRRASLEAGQNHRVEVLVIFPGKGRLEGRIHAHFDGCRSALGAGREWFAIPASDAAGAVAKALFDMGAT